MINESQTDWDEKIDTVLMAYRSSQQSSTKYSPVFYYVLQYEEYVWGCFKPLTPLNMKQPRNVLDDNPLIVVPSHFELLYYKNSHYDCIVSSSDSCVPNDFPLVEEKVVDVIIFDE